MPRAEQDEEGRRQSVLDAAMAVLAEKGYAGATMLAIATRANASKETLYALFANKQALLAALVQRNAAAINRDIATALRQPEAEIEPVLVAFGEKLLTLLLGAGAVSLNRAAIATAEDDPTLGRILVANGRERTGKLMADFLATQARMGRLALRDSGEALGVLFGLLVRDWQVQRLLGAADAPLAAEIAARARDAARKFLMLHAADRGAAR